LAKKRRAGAEGSLLIDVGGWGWGRARPGSAAGIAPLGTEMGERGLQP